MIHVKKFPKAYGSQSKKKKHLKTHKIKNVQQNSHNLVRNLCGNY